MYVGRLTCKLAKGQQFLQTFFKWSCLITMQLDESQLTRLNLSLGITHAAAAQKHVLRLPLEKVLADFQSKLQTAEPLDNSACMDA